MHSEDVNRVVLLAVLHVIEAWVEEDRAAASLANGVLSRAERQSAVARAHEKRAQASQTLADRLPSQAHANLSAGLGAAAPRPNAPVGDTVRRWAKPEHRLATARALLKAAAVAQRQADERAESERRAAEAETQRLAAEEAERAAKAEAEARRRAERAAVLATYRTEAEAVLQEDFLGADSWFGSWDTGGAVSRDDFDHWKADFVRRWARDVLRDDRLDMHQARAVAATSGDLRLVARAGSGKTRTLVTRALFLQQHCGVDPGSILLVAFNRKAVEEIKGRIRESLPARHPLPHVVTFHALGYALLRPEEELVFDDEDSESLAQSRKVQAVVDEFLVTRADEVRRAMLRHFMDDWTRIQHRGLHLGREEFFAARAQVTRVTLGGEYVKSFGERLIANVLFEHGVEYKYERNFTRAGFNYRPDFTVLVDRKARVVIEYFGVTGDPEYQRNAERKRAFWQDQQDLTFAEFTPAQITSLGEERFRAMLLDLLGGAGVPHRRLTEDEIWARVRRRAVDTFSKALRGVVNRARQLNLAPDDLRDRMHALVDPADHVLGFLDLASDIYEEYLTRAQVEGYEDFSGVIWRATECVRAGRTSWLRAGGKERGDLKDLRFIHIDEFQDLSLMFMEFIQAIRTQAPHASLCCVGDDWQAINGFAGADLRFFENFDTDFAGSSTRQLTTNYRSTMRIVSAGNAVMAERGDPAHPSNLEHGTIQVARLDDFRPSAHERECFPGDVGTPALLRLLKRGLAVSDGNVAVLFRRNTVPWFTDPGQSPFGRKLHGYLKYLQGHFDSEEAERIEVTTSHKYKGSEAEFVIVADADEKWYPLIHPTAELFQIFGDTIDRLTDAERRLFYVATTRAERALCYLVTTGDPSPFLTPASAAATTIRWDDLPESVSADGTNVEIRVYDAYEVREVLKDRFGFKYDEHSKTWYILRPAEGFDFQAVRGTLDFIGPRLIEVRDAKRQVIHRAGSRLNAAF